MKIEAKIKILSDEVLDKGFNNALEQPQLSSFKIEQRIWLTFFSKRKKIMAENGKIVTNKMFPNFYSTYSILHLRIGPIIIFFNKIKLLCRDLINMIYELKFK